jgi:hypothetical protein
MALIFLCIVSHKFDSRALIFSVSGFWFRRELICWTKLQFTLARKRILLAVSGDLVRIRYFVDTAPSRSSRRTFVYRSIRLGAWGRIIFSGARERARLRIRW